MINKRVTQWKCLHTSVTQECVCLPVCVKQHAFHAIRIIQYKFLLLWTSFRTVNLYTKNNERKKSNEGKDENVLFYLIYV